ncbi:hypothetical protein N3K66_008315 [Trichothecium roseum]|uniref:Uncharacterized protein n=1 Tax=Trichothecium roseum TaxID=47278 RepID=A0ACC0UTH0_9HYPO|nr:hypothetical protein N3K66_008315 [Trichothecium roseum]
MRLSTSALAVAFAAVPMAAAFSTYNATLHTDTACGDAKPYSMDGTGYTDCVALEQTHNSISAFEDEPTGYCHFLLFSDDACATKLDSVDTLDGACNDVAGINSFRVSCYR